LNNPVTSFTVNNLIRGQSYIFIIIAVNLNGLSIPSIKSTFYTCILPTDFNSLKFVSSDISNKTISISWYSPLFMRECAITGYKIFWAVDSLSNTRIEVTGINNSDPNLSSYTVALSSQPIGSIHNFQIQARNAVGTVLSNNITSALSGLPNKPNPPSLINDQTTKFQIMLILDNVSGNRTGVFKYEIQNHEARINLANKNTSDVLFTSANTILIIYTIYPYK